MGKHFLMLRSPKWRNAQIIIDKNDSGFSTKQKLMSSVRCFTLTKNSELVIFCDISTTYYPSPWQPPIFPFRLPFVWSTRAGQPAASSIQFVNFLSLVHGLLWNSGVITGPNSMPSNSRILRKTEAFQSEIQPPTTLSQTDLPKRPSKAWNKNHRWFMEKWLLRL